MKKKALGQLIREARLALQLSQRTLGQSVGAEASHIAYIENGRRNPSLALLRRLADVLLLDRREAFFLAYPDAQYLVRDRSKDLVAKRQESAWKRFASNKSLLKRHRVTRAELKILKQVSLLQHVSYSDHFLFILNSIRQAGVRGD